MLGCGGAAWRVEVYEGFGKLTLGKDFGERAGHGGESIQGQSKHTGRFRLERAFTKQNPVFPDTLL